MCSLTSTSVSIRGRLPRPPGRIFRQKFARKRRPLASSSRCSGSARPHHPALDLPGKDDPLNEFYARAKERLVTQRKLLQDIGRESGDPARQKLLTNLHFEMGVLKDEAGFPEALPVWQAASALEGLLKQLTEKIRNVTPSTLRTVAGGLDLLDDLCVPGLPPDLLTDRPLKFLVVDDDLISRQALSLSLEKAFSQPDLAVDGETALAQATPAGL